MLKLNAREKTVLNKVFYEYFLNYTKRNICFDYNTNEEKEDLLSLEEKGFITNLTFIHDIYSRRERALFQLTQKSLDWLKETKIYNKKWNNEHDKIIYQCMEILGKNKDQYLFSDFELGVGARPDLLIINKDEDFTELKPIILEIKHSRNDFFSDIKKPEKRAKYLKFCSKMYYVCQENVIKKEEVPEECGLIYLMSNESKLNIIKDVEEREVLSSNNIETLLTLLVRTFQYDLNIQIGIKNKEEKVISYKTEKQEARSLEKSFSFSLMHKNIINDIKNGYSRFRLNSMNYNLFLDLFIWGIVFFEDKNLKLTQYGEEVLKEIEKHKIEPPEIFKKIDMSKNNCFKDVIIKGIKVPIVSVSLTKKPNNLKIKAYQKIEDFNGIPEWMVEDSVLNYLPEVYLISEKEIDKKLLPKNIGFMKEYERTTYIEKRVKEKRIVLEKDQGVLLKLLLIKTKEENDYNYLIIK